MFGGSRLLGQWKRISVATENTEGTEEAGPLSAAHLCDRTGGHATVRAESALAGTPQPQTMITTPRLNMTSKRVARLMSLRLRQTSGMLIGYLESH